MERDEIIRLAKEAGCIQGELAIANVPQLERFANLVAAAERERCAKVCDHIADIDPHYMNGYACAAKIRAMESES